MASDIMKKINKITDLSPSIQEAQQALLMKSGMVDDILRDLIVKDLGLKLDDRGNLTLPLPELIKAAYEAGYRDGKMT